MTDELDLRPAKYNDIVDCQCPVCDQEFSDNCPPDYEQEENIKCPQCGKGLTVRCEVTIEREYTMEVEYLTDK